MSRHILANCAVGIILKLNCYFIFFSNYFTTFVTNSIKIGFNIDNKDKKWMSYYLTSAMRKLHFPS